MTFLVNLRRLPLDLAGRYAPWSGDTWRATRHVLAGGVVGVVTGSIVLTLVILSAVLSITVIFALGTLLALLSCVHGFAALQRSRFEALLGEQIDAPATVPCDSWSQRLVADFRSETTWRQLAYHLLALVFGGAGALAVAIAWSGSALLVIAPLLGWSPAGPGVLRALAAMTGGVVLLFAAPLLAHGVAAADLVAARALLGPNVKAELAMRVVEVERSRADLVAAADAERRRIERDLHDGMQQRLVALAMNLGIVRVNSGDLPEPLRDAISRSHDDAKEALTELRHIVRGLYPAVLGDRGLDAALSGIVASSPVPARLRADLPRRPPVAIEAVAYFVVAEALANVAKHALASQVEVEVRLVEELQELRLLVADNGRGGARPGRGSGLRGLAQRVSSVDGTLAVDSPEGGPTTILVVLPCAS
ncbi:sensor domain-containing protein [Actinoplanes sp. NPDC023801]|uniref:sensor histidine kinase n=1 Tax=Actinoplanes sp. NPDC023801 TaxID=3154595 RepID=UPI003402DE7B